VRQKVSCSFVHSPRAPEPGEATARCTGESTLSVDRDRASLDAVGLRQCATAGTGMTAVRVAAIQLLFNDVRDVEH